jgi:phenol 2-monooxygenase
MEKIKDTTYNFTLVLRQMYTEAILREKLESTGAPYYQGMECIDFKVDEAASLESHGVISTFTERKTQKTFQLKR